MKSRPNIAPLVFLAIIAVLCPARAQQTPCTPSAGSNRATPPEAKSANPAEQPKVDAPEAPDIRPLMINALPPGTYRDRLVQLCFEKFHSENDPQAILGLEVPIYAKYLSDDEIRGLIQLYQTPLGKKLLLALPQIAADAQQASNAWGRELGRKVMHEILAEHPDLAQDLENAAKAQSLK